MKKIFLVAALIMVAFSGSCFAQTKAQTKEAKKQAKVLQSEGWEAEGHRTIEGLLIDFILLEEENEIYIGRAEDYDSKGVAKNMARIDAMQSCVEEASMFFKGVIDRMQGKLNSETADNITNTSAAKFEGKIAQGFKSKFNLYKVDKNGRISCQSFCYINREKAEELKKTALQEAAEEATIEAKAIGDFSKEVTNIINNHAL